MSFDASVSSLQDPLATPRPTTFDLPDVPSTPIVNVAAAPVQVLPTRKQAREDRYLKFLEEERLDDERALATITNKVVTLRMPVKAEFEDLDGLTHSPPPCLRLSRSPVRRADPVHARPPISPAVHHPQFIPPLTPEATIRAAVNVNRRAHLPAVFKAPGSPQLSSRRSASARRRASTERERMCRTGSSA